MDKNNKILVSDYDRTYYVSDDGIEENKSTIEKFRKAGNIFIIATGRSYEDYKRKADQYDIKSDYVILNHGAMILNKDEGLDYNFTISNDIIEDLVSDLQVDKSIRAFSCVGKTSYEDLAHKDITKIHIRYDDAELFYAIKDKINQKYAEYIHTYQIWGSAMEIISSATDKSYAIGLLADKEGLKRDNIYTIGDGHSDVEMIKNYKGYCMTESIPLLKTLALGECESVSELAKKIMQE